MRRQVAAVLGVLAGLCCVLALYNGFVPVRTDDGLCGIPVRDAFSDSAEPGCAEDSAGNVGSALMWALLGLPATLGYAVARHDSDG